MHPVGISIIKIIIKKQRQRVKRTRLWSHKTSTMQWMLLSNWQSQTIQPFMCWQREHSVLCPRYWNVSIQTMNVLFLHDSYSEIDDNNIVRNIITANLHDFLLSWYFINISLLFVGVGVCLCCPCLVLYYYAFGFRIR